MGDKIESTATQTYNVDAKLSVGSGATTADIIADPPADTVYNQGSLITVCVYPDADAAADGIVMNNIDSYTWRRQDPEVGGVLPPETYQNAIGSGSADANGLNVDVNALDDGPGMLAPAGSSAASFGVSAVVAFGGLVAS